MTKHTPGPWVFYSSEPSIDPNWHHVTNASRMRVLANVHVEPGNATDLANIRLITAAPDLLDALIEAEQALNAVRVHSLHAPWDSTGPAIIKARAAIAKTTGVDPTPAPVEDATQGALFDLPAAKPPSAIAEGR